MNDPKAPADWLKIDGAEALVELALNLHWSWNHAADDLWEELDKELWATTQNPWVILRTVSKEKLQAALAAPAFRQRLDSLLSHNRASYSADAWFQRKHPGSALTPEFSASRAIREYTGNHYLPAASNYQQRAAEDSRQGLGVLHWREELDRHWNTVRFGAVRVETHDGQHFFQVEVSLGTLNPDQICVELYANSNDGSKSSIEVMKTRNDGANSQGMFTYSAQVPATRASSDYTARIIPHHANVSVPLEAGQILWQH